MALDQAAEEHEQRSIDDGVAVQDPGHVVERRIAEVLADVRQRDVDDEQVEIGHDEAGADDRQHLAGRRPGVADGDLVSGRG